MAAPVKQALFRDCFRPVPKQSENTQGRNSRNGLKNRPKQRWNGPQNSPRNSETTPYRERPTVSAPRAPSRARQHAPLTPQQRSADAALTLRRRSALPDCFTLGTDHPSHLHHVVQQTPTLVREGAGDDLVASSAALSVEISGSDRSMAARRCAQRCTGCSGRASCYHENQSQVLPVAGHINGKHCQAVDLAAIAGLVACVAASSARRKGFKYARNEVRLTVEGCAPAAKWLISPKTWDFPTKRPGWGGGRGKTRPGWIFRAVIPLSRRPFLKSVAANCSKTGGHS